MIDAFYEFTCSLIELWANGSGSEPSSLSRIRLQISTAYLFRSSITKREKSISLLEECVHRHNLWLIYQLYHAVHWYLLVTNLLVLDYLLNIRIEMENLRKRRSLPVSVGGFKLIKSSKTLFEKQTSIKVFCLCCFHYFVLIAKTRFIFIRRSSYRIVLLLSTWSVCLAIVWHNSRNSRWIWE